MCAMGGVTISAPYGAGGSELGPAVADRLGLPFLDRAISSAVAEQLLVTVEEADEGTRRMSRLERALTLLSPLAPVPEHVPAEPYHRPDEAGFRARADAVMLDAVRGAGAVVLGRAGAVALRGEPGVLHVRLHGDVAARTAQGARIEGVDPATAREHQRTVDRARTGYMKRLYGMDPDDERLYHLQLDSTVLPMRVCLDLVVTAYDAVAGGPGRT